MSQLAPSAVPTIPSVRSTANQADGAELHRSGMRPGCDQGRQPPGRHRRVKTSATNKPASSAEPGSSLGSAASGVGFATVGSAAGAALGLVLTLAVTHSLSPTTAGQFFSSTTVFLVVQTVFSFGVGAGLVRFVPRYIALNRHRDIRTLLVVAMGPVTVGGAIGSIVLWLLAPALGNYLGHGQPTRLTSTFHVVAFVFLPSTLEVAAVECTRAFGSIRRYVLIQQLGIPLARPLLVWTAIAAGLPLAGIVTAWVLPLFLALVLAAASVRASTRELLDPEMLQSSVTPGTPWRVVAREFWSFAAARGLAMVMDTLLNWLDIVLVAGMVSASQAAVYTAISRFILAGTLVLQAMRLALARDISFALARQDVKTVSTIYRTATQWVVLASWPMYLLLAMFAPTVLKVFGPGYSSGASVSVILCLAMMVYLTAGNVGTVLLMGGKSNWVLADKTVCVIVNVGLNFLLIPHLGIRGAALAWAATIVLDSSLAYSQVRWGMMISGRLDGVLLAGLLSVGAFGGGGIVCRLVFGSTPLGLCVALVVGTALFVGPVAALHRQLGLDAFTGLLWKRRPISESSPDTGAVALP